MPEASAKSMALRMATMYSGQKPSTKKPVKQTKKVAKKKK